MHTLITRHRVHDYDTWRAAFAGHQANRIQHGALGHRIYSDKNDVTVLTDFPDRTSVDRFLADPALLDVVSKAGFIDPPVTVISHFDEDDRYIHVGP